MEVLVEPQLNNRMQVNSTTYEIWLGCSQGETVKYLDLKKDSASHYIALNIDTCN